MVQALNGHMQAPIMSPALDGYLLIGKGEVIVGSDIVDDASEALHRDVLGYMGFIQDFGQKRPMRLRVHE